MEISKAKFSKGGLVDPHKKMPEMAKVPRKGETVIVSSNEMILSKTQQDMMFSEIMKEENRVDYSNYSGYNGSGIQCYNGYLLFIILFVSLFGLLLSILYLFCG